MGNNKILNIENYKTITIVLIVILIILITPTFLTLPSIYKFLNFDKTGQIGDTIGGITAPFLNGLTIILVFIAFKAQIKANECIKEQTDILKDQTKILKEQRLSSELFDILKISLEYPYFEDRIFTEKWNSQIHKIHNKEAETLEKDYLRYDIYCNLIFNYLSEISDFYSYNKNDIENFINIKDWIRIHKQCWENPREAFENTDSYSIEFRELITNYLK